MKNDDLILLLQLINKDGNIENLRKKGYEYSQIAKFISILLEEKYVKYNDQGLELTEKGLDLLNEKNKELKRKNSEAFISPQSEYILEKKLNPLDIYLPANLKNLD